LLHFVLFEQALIWIPGPTETGKGNKPQKQIHLTTKNPNHTKKGRPKNPYFLLNFNDNFYYCIYKIGYICWSYICTCIYQMSFPCRLPMGPHSGFAFFELGDLGFLVGFQVPDKELPHAIPFRAIGDGFAIGGWGRMIVECPG
jgi:hypothetical protein